MFEKWNDYDLPEESIINGNVYKIDFSYKNVLEVINALNDESLLDEEKIYAAGLLFYFDYESISEEDLEEAIEMMILFINGNRNYETVDNKKPLMDWKKDLSVIIAPINKIAGQDIRRNDDLHWWTFLSYFMEIGECTFNTYVGIREKKRKGKKLEKHEEEIYKQNKSAIDLDKKYDGKTQSALDEINRLLAERR